MIRSGGAALLRALRQGTSVASAESGAAQALPAGTVAGTQRRTSSTRAEAAAAGAAASAIPPPAGNEAMTPRRGWLGLLGVGAVAAGAGAQMALAEEEADHGLHAPQYPWDHSGAFSSYDHSAIRRGHQVYQQVCAACHSVYQLHFRDLVGVAYTEDEVKAMALEIEVADGPNDEGEMYERPGRLSDPLPRPYANEEAARYANGGAYPPDLSLITKARHDGQNYVFSLLLGYRDPPAGVNIREGLHYNPYFIGGAIAMPKMLVDEGTEYDDETPATESQQAKDVVTFLSWAAEPEMDDRKLMGAKFISVLALCLVTAVYYKRWKWAPLKSRRIVLDVIH